MLCDRWSIAACLESRRFRHGTRTFDFHEMRIKQRNCCRIQVMAGTWKRRSKKHGATEGSKATVVLFFVATRTRQPLILLIPNNQVGGPSFQNAIEIQYAFNTPNLDLKVTNVPLLNVIAKRTSLF